MIECARHAHTFGQINQFAFIVLFFVVALFQRIQIPVFFDVPKDCIHHDAGLVIWDVRNHGFVRDRIVLVVQHIIYVILNIWP